MKQNEKSAAKLLAHIWHNSIKNCSIWTRNSNGKYSIRRETPKSAHTIQKIMLKERKSEYHLDKTQEKIIYKLISGN